MKSLPREFYDRDTLEVAKDLLGCLLVREYEGERLVGRITETEAYIGRCDKACHAYGYKRTGRTETLFARPGTAYLYLIYGMYTCLNFCHRAGRGTGGGAHPRHRGGSRGGDHGPAALWRGPGEVELLSAQELPQRSGQGV